MHRQYLPQLTGDKPNRHEHTVARLDRQSRLIFYIYQLGYLFAEVAANLGIDSDIASEQAVIADHKRLRRVIGYPHNPAEFAAVRKLAAPKIKMNR
ncbi:hypothetical protein ES703_123774 [subsurface metagenome]